VYSWRRLGEVFSVDHKTAKARHETAVVTLASRLRQLPAPCAATVRRIQAYIAGDI
jgi:hypothetical protein